MKLTLNTVDLIITVLRHGHTSTTLVFYMHMVEIG